MNTLHAPLAAATLLATAALLPAQTKFMVVDRESGDLSVSEIAYASMSTGWDRSVSTVAVNYFDVAGMRTKMAKVGASASAPAGGLTTLSYTLEVLGEKVATTRLANSYSVFARKSLTAAIGQVDFALGSATMRLCFSASSLAEFDGRLSGASAVAAEIDGNLRAKSGAVSVTGVVNLGSYDSMQSSSIDSDIRLGALKLNADIRAFGSASGGRVDVSHSSVKMLLRISGRFGVRIWTGSHDYTLHFDVANDIAPERSWSATTFPSLVF